MSRHAPHPRLVADHGLDRPEVVDLFTAVGTGIAAQQHSNEPGGDRWTRLVNDAAAAIELGLVDELRMCGNPGAVGGGTHFPPPVTQDIRLDLVETRTFGSRMIYERYRRARDESD